MKQLNKHSKRLTQDATQPAAQAMLYAVGLNDEDMKKPQVGIASTGYDGNPCNMHLNHLAAGIKEEVNSGDRHDQAKEKQAHAAVSTTRTFHRRLTGLKIVSWPHYSRKFDGDSTQGYERDPSD